MERTRNEITRNGTLTTSARHELWMVQCRVFGPSRVPTPAEPSMYIREVNALISALTLMLKLRGIITLALVGVALFQQPSSTLIWVREL